MKKLVKQNKFVEPNMTKYFERLSEGPELEVLEQPCEDCAVTCGLYLPYARELAKETVDLQDRALSTWDCHNHRDHACRGAYNYVHSKRK